MTILKTVEGRDMVAFIWEAEALGIFALSKNLALHCNPGPFSTDCPYNIEVISCWSFFSVRSSHNKTRHSRTGVEAPAPAPSPPCQHYPTKVCTSKHPPVTSCHTHWTSNLHLCFLPKKWYCSTALRMFWMLWMAGRGGEKIPQDLRTKRNPKQVNSSHYHLGLPVHAEILWLRLLFKNIDALCASLMT